MEIPVFVMIGPHCQPANQPQLFAIEESRPLSAKNRAGQIGRSEIVFSGCVGSEGSARYTCRQPSLDIDDARPFQKQRIARERRVDQGHEGMEISDGRGYRLDAGVVDVGFE